MLESFWFFGFSLDDKIIVVFTLKYFYHFTFTCALFSFQGTFSRCQTLDARYQTSFVFTSTLFPEHLESSIQNLVSRMVGSSGLEPPTSRLSGVRSNHLSYEPIQFSRGRSSLAFGGDERDRTDDPLLAKQVLSQLSYTPIFSSML